MFTYLKNETKYEVYNDDGIIYSINKTDLIYHDPSGVPFEIGNFINLIRNEAIIVFANMWDDVIARYKGKATKGVLYD